MVTQALLKGLSVLIIPKGHQAEDELLDILQELQRGKVKQDVIL